VKLAPEREEEDLVSEAEAGEVAGDSGELQPGQELAATSSEQTWGFNRARMPGTIADQTEHEMTCKEISLKLVKYHLIMIEFFLK